MKTRVKTKAPVNPNAAITILGYSTSDAVYDIE